MAPRKAVAQVRAAIMGVTWIRMQDSASSSGSAVYTRMILGKCLNSFGSPFSSSVNSEGWAERSCSS